MPKKFRKNNICYNCHEKIADHNYCPNCGQVNSHKQIHIKQILKELLGDVFTFDSKFFKSIIPLLGKPGHLTNEYIAGKRVQYILPLRLYVFTTFLFFFVLSLSGTFSPYSLEVEEKLKVTDDSLKQYLDHYKTDVPDNVLDRMILEMGLKYRIEKNPKATVSNEFQDSLKIHLLKSNPAIADSVSAYYARQLDGVFYWYKKKAENKKVTSENDSLDMEALLDHYQFTRSSKIKFRSWLDTNYRYKKVTWKQRGSNFTIASDTSGVKRTNITISSDTSKGGMFSEIEKKAGNIFSQGEKGLRIFLSEAVRQIPKIMFFLLPVFALLLKLFFIRQRIFYFNHLIFSLHIHSLIFMYLLIAVFFPNEWVIFACLIAIWIHSFMAFKNVYKQKWWIVFLKLNTIIGLYNVVLFMGFIAVSILAVWNA